MNPQSQSSWLKNVRAAACVALLALPLNVSAGIAEGLGWLATQPNANGSFGGTPASLATEVRSTAEVVRAYQELGQQSQPSYAAALNYLNSDTATQTRFLAGKILINAQAGNDVTAWVNELLTHQNADGSFGDQVGYGSSVLDTTFALQAFAATNTTDGVAQAVGFLLSRQQAAGGWADGDNEPSVHLTAQAFRALWSYRNNYIGVNAALGKAQNFLLSRQDASGAWSENFNTALALIALIPHVTDLSLVNASVSTLQTAQLANGSWDDDLK